MVNFALALLSTFITWLVTTVTTGVSLPFFQLVMIMCIVYLTICKVKDKDGV